MAIRSYIWRGIVPVILGLLALPGCRNADNAWDGVATPLPHTDHTALVAGPLEDGPAATRECLRCHPDDAREVMATSHWTWLGHEAIPRGKTETVRIGKRNLINNYCVSIQSNWDRCTACHAGYGWTDASFDFDDASSVDCLVCHDQTGTYVKSPTGGGFPLPDVDLLAVARSVGRPTRRNCGYCHFQGGGGDAVKHGDLDGTFYYPTERIDVHMGGHSFQCVDCHRTDAHEMRGHALSVSVDAEEGHRLLCTDCHAEPVHENERLNAHTDAVACQTCHIPRMAVGAPTKMEWDWSQAGQDREEDPHEYLKIKGSFRYDQGVVPEYHWYNGRSFRYLMGDPVDPDTVTVLNQPDGDIGDPDARIWPFKVHVGSQIYDAANDYLLVPKTVGAGGYWTEFDWDLAARLGSEASGLAYSGSYGFTRTAMFWPITHMVATAADALQCADCHGESGRMNWSELGYDGDPAYRGNPRAALVTDGGASR